MWLYALMTSELQLARLPKAIFTTNKQAFCRNIFVVIWCLNLPVKHLNISCAYHSLWWIPEGSVLWLTSMVNGEWWIQVVSVAWWVSAYTSQRSSWPGECYTGIGEEAVSVIVTVLDFTRFNCSPASTKLEIKRFPDSITTVSGKLGLFGSLRQPSPGLNGGLRQYCHISHHVTCHVTCHLTSHVM